MNKSRKPLIILAAAVVVVAIAAIVIFLLRPSDEPAAPAMDLSLNGTWKVLVHRDERMDQEYFVFKDGKAECYRDGAAEPVLTDDYTLDGANLELATLGLKAVIKPVTDNYIKMEENGAPIWQLLRVADGAFGPQSLNGGALEGTWDVKVHGSTPTVNETLTFEEGWCTDRRNGDEVYMTSAFSLSDDGHLTIEAANLTVEIYPLEGDVLMLVQVEDGYVWQIEKAKA